LCAETDALSALLAQVDRLQVERRLEFAALPEGWAAVGLIALAVALGWAIVWMYRREGRAGASLRVRLVMAALRCAVMGLLLAIWLQPVLATYLHRLIDSYTLVLVDTSSSMDLQDRYHHADEIERVRTVAPQAGKSPIRRSALVHAVLSRDNNRFLEQLTAANRVKVYTFAESPQARYTLQAVRESRYASVEQSQPREDAEPVLARAQEAATSFAAHGAATDLGKALRQAVETLGRQPVAGVVIFTDGGLNRGDNAEALARYAAERKLALHIVGVGDPSPPHNVRVAEVVAPDSVFAEDPFAVIVQLAAQGMAGQTVTVELRERRAESEDPGRVVASQSVTITEDEALIPLTFRHAQDEVGRYTYQVSVPVGETESVADDNVKQATVNVIENKLRVLLVAGAPNWDYRYLSRLLTRDETFELSCWLQSADETAVRDGDVIIDHLPSTPEELFQYDVIVLLDPDPLEFTPELSELMADLVSRHGGGLLYAAARLHAPSFARDPATQPVLRALPVTLDPDAELVLNEIGHYQQQPSPVLVEPTALGHPVLRLPDSLGPEASWSNLAEVYWHLPVLREKPVATVLLRHGDPRMQNTYGPHVLLATQYVGAGRTAFLAMDGTWRWRAHSVAAFDKFWIQMLRYLVEGKLAGGNRRGMLVTEAETHQLGEVVRISARLFDPAFRPLTDESVEGEYRLGDDRGKFTLQRLADRPGWYEGRLVPGRTGSCELILPIPGEALTSEPARREIQIVRPNVEILEPQLNRDVLVGLAEQSAGGRYYDLSEAGALPGNIPDRHESTTIRSRPVPLWDDAWMLVALVVLLATEWTMRKIFKLL
jgi:hypothetical protein